jgi:hypothetical protein
MKFFALVAFLATSVFANSNDLAHRPKSFSFAQGTAVFVDFKEVTYTIVYDISKKAATAKADILFDAPEAGYPVFDSYQVPYNVILDGVDVGALEVKTPSSETTLRVAGKQISTGAHKLSVEVPLTELIQWNSDGVKSAFWTSDLDNREFMERYMPANFEFDQVKMTFNISYIGQKKKQRIYTNGVISEKSSGVTIAYPAHFTSSSIFYHNVPEGTFAETSYSYRSIDGRELPVVIYGNGGMWGSSLETLKKNSQSILEELEKDYGPWLHPSVTIYNAGSGGMEYCGATMTDAGSMGHELFHSYFARGVMPANGNSGWLDEALASWRDKGYTSSTSLSGSSKMSAHPYYTRTTDMDAYTFGARFMSFMDGKTQEKGGLKKFMRHMVEKRSLKPIFVEEFYQEMSSFYGMSFESDFKKYTYGSSSSNLKMAPEDKHQKMSLAELKKFL